MSLIKNFFQNSSLVNTTFRLGVCIIANSSYRRAVIHESSMDFEMCEVAPMPIASLPAARGPVGAAPRAVCPSSWPGRRTQANQGFHFRPSFSCLQPRSGSQPVLTSLHPLLMHIPACFPSSLNYIDETTFSKSVERFSPPPSSNL